MQTSVVDKIISKLYLGYIKLVVKTSIVEMKNDVSNEVLNNCILGFWHGDSFVMNLLLDKIKNDNKNVNVVVTYDKRGDYIADIIKNYGANPLRMPDGIKMKSFLRELKAKSCEKDSTLAIALDGPIGPYRQAKKIAFMLANESEKNCVIVNSTYTRKIHLNRRWDKYVIPLPFTKVEFNFNNVGIITREELKDFDTFINTKGIL